MDAAILNSKPKCDGDDLAARLAALTQDVGTSAQSFRAKAKAAWQSERAAQVKDAVVTGAVIGAGVGVGLVACDLICRAYVAATY